MLQEASDNAATDAILTVLDTIRLWVSDAVGEPMAGIQPRSASSDEEQITIWRNSVLIVKALNEGDAAQAADVARTAIVQILTDLGLEFDFVVLWPWLAFPCWKVSVEPRIRGSVGGGYVALTRARPGVGSIASRGGTVLCRQSCRPCDASQRRSPGSARSRQLGQVAP